MTKSMRHILSHSPILHTQEPDGSRGIPFFDFGSYPTADEMAKISQLLQDYGEYQGQQLLHPGKTQEALFRTSNLGIRTYQADSEAGLTHYLMSFWSVPYIHNDCRLQIPQMAGYRGIEVVLLPNGVSVFRFADANITSVGKLIQAGFAVSDWCQ